MDLPDLDNIYGHLLQLKVKVKQLTGDLAVHAAILNTVGHMLCQVLLETIISAILEVQTTRHLAIFIISMIFYGMEKDVVLTALVVNSTILHGFRQHYHRVLPKISNYDFAMVDLTQILM